MSGERSESESEGAHMSGRASTAGDRAREGNFPAGLRVIVVDDDPLCLRVVERMLQRCSYRVTTFSNATEALKMLRTKKELVDIVLSDVHMPDMDGFKLLEAIGLDLNIPVIMMSSNSDTDVVLRGVKHGAVDYLLKPVAIKELRNIWQHVVRQRATDENCAMPSGQGISQGRETLPPDSRKRKDGMGMSPSDGDGKGGKKQRIVWTADLHQKFVNAVNMLGIEKSVPKRILDLMDVPVLTRENVASHLQKYRLYLKKMKSADMQASPQAASKVSDTTMSGAEEGRGVGGIRAGSGVNGGGVDIENDGGGGGAILQGAPAQIPAHVAPGLTHGHQTLIPSTVHHGSVVIPATVCAPMNVPTPGHLSMAMEIGVDGVARGGGVGFYATTAVPDGGGHIVTGLVPHGMRPEHDSKQLGLKLNGSTPAMNVSSMPEWVVDNSQLRDSVVCGVNHPISVRDPRDDLGDAWIQMPNHYPHMSAEQQMMQQQYSQQQYFQHQQQQQVHIQNRAEQTAVLAEQANKAAQELTDPLQVYLND